MYMERGLKALYRERITHVQNGLTDRSGDALDWPIGGQSEEVR